MKHAALLVISIATFLLQTSFAMGQMSFEQAVEEGRAIGNSGPQGKDAANALINDLISSGVPGLTPEAQSQAGTQGNFFLDNPDQLTPQGESSANTTDTGQFLQESYNLRPRVNLDPADPMITLSENMASGTGGCVTQRVYSQPTTEVVSATQHFSCSIDFAETGAQCNYPLPQPVRDEGNGSGRLCVDHRLYARIYQETQTRFHLQLLDTGPRGDFHRNCGGSDSGGGIDDWHTIRIVNLPTPPISFNFDLSASGRGCSTATVRLTSFNQSVEVIRCGSGGAQSPSYSFTYSFVMPAPPLNPQTVQNACGTYMNRSACRLVNEQCDGFSCTRSYVCSDLSQPVDNCGTYRDQGCLLETESCALTDENGLCISRQQIYACTTQTIQEGCAEERIETICPSAPQGIRCMDPNECADTTSIPNQDLALAASHLASLNAIEDDATPDPLIIFTGDAESCRKTVLSGNTRDCCAMDTALIGCNANEEQLQSHRNNGMCVEVGTYCSRRISLGFTTVCVERTTSFCCFSSKLVRIIQEQGRPQLGISWGAPENPDCRGFTPEELRRIDFQAINFEEYYGDINAQAPDPTMLMQQTQGSQSLTPQPNSVPPPPTINQGQAQQDLDNFFGTHAP
jgi:hypothetical protein